MIEDFDVVDEIITSFQNYALHFAFNLSNTLISRLNVLNTKGKAIVLIK